MLTLMSINTAGVKQTMEPLGNQSELAAIMKIDTPSSIQEVSLAIG